MKKGQRLFQVMPALYQAEHQKAQAEAVFALIEYRNTKGLADKDVVSPNELALSKAKLDKANAEMAIAKVHRRRVQLKPRRQRRRTETDGPWYAGAVAHSSPAHRASPADLRRLTDPPTLTWLRPPDSTCVDTPNFSHLRWQSSLRTS